MGRADPRASARPPRATIDVWIQLENRRDAPRGEADAFPARPPQTWDVHITAENFTPAKVFILSGDSVRWINDARRAHGPKSLNGTFKGNALSPTQDYTEQFPTPGYYEYNCIYDDHRNNASDLTDPAVVVFAQLPGITGSPGAGSATPPAATGAGTPPAPGGTPTTHDVTIGSLGFSPASVTIKAGDSVRWTNNDSSPHTATGDDHAWTSPMLSGGQSFFRAFPSAGTVPYHCHIHHEMTATVVVT
jgi:plastocyanin